MRALAHASQLEPADAGLVNDLAVAEFESGMTDQDLRSMLRALEAVEQAIEIDSTLASARFNRALFLDRLYLSATADSAWSVVMATEEDRDWRYEASVRRDSLRARNVTTLLAQGARDSGLVLLREWGAAQTRWDTTRATTLLNQVRTLSASVGADRTLVDAIRSIDSASSPERLAVLARAHEAYGEGVRSYNTARYEEAVQRLRAAATGFRLARSPVEGWAWFYRAASDVNLGQFDRADTSFIQALAVASPTQPALTGKATWARGVSQVRRGNLEEALRFYRQAQPSITNANEPENDGALAFVISDALLMTGQWSEGAIDAHRSIRQLSRFRRSSFLSNHLNVLARYAREAQLRRAALAVMNEAVLVARTTERTDVTTWAFVARSQDFALLGRLSDAKRDLDSAMHWAERMPTGIGRDRVMADVRLGAAALERAGDPVTAVRLASEALAAYRRVGLSISLPNALYEAAIAARATADSAAARSRISEAIDLLERQALALSTPEARAAHSEMVETFFDLLIGFDDDGGNPDSAFVAIERGRRAAWRPESGAHTARLTPIHAPGEVVDRLPPDMALVQFALLPDRVISWTLTSGGWKSHRIAVRRDSVAGLVARFANGGQANQVPSEAEDLYELLIRPIESTLKGRQRLAIVADRELWQVPFAALRDPKSGRRLIESYELISVPSAHFLLDAIDADREGGGRGAKVLVVGNPTLPTTSVSWQPSLPGARREAEQVAQLHPQHTLLLGGEARRGEFLRQASSARLIHFAGHAFFNRDRPELSYLALAPDPGNDGQLRAREIGELSLSNVEVAVLSACSTLSPRATRNGPATGLAHSFLRAGIPAIVSTLWDVTDAGVVDLLVELHRGLAEGLTAGAALRRAQLQVLQSSSAEASSGAWAAFVYTGP